MAEIFEQDNPCDGPLQLVAWPAASNAEPVIDVYADCHRGGEVDGFQPANLHFQFARRRGGYGARNSTKTGTNGNARRKSRYNAGRCRPRVSVGPGGWPTHGDEEGSKFIHDAFEKIE